MPSTRIFLSYAGDDQARVSALARKLSRAGHLPWLVERDLYPGEAWKRAIRKAIRESDLFIACLTRNSVDDRGYTHVEIREALEVRNEMPEDRIYLIPIRFEECEVPEQLADIQYLNYFNERGWNALKGAIDEAMNRRDKTAAPQSIPIEIANRSFRNTNRRRLASAVASFLRVATAEVRITLIERGIARITIETQGDTSARLRTAIEKRDRRLLRCFSRSVSSRERNQGGGSR